MKTTRALLGARIKELRKLRQITQEQLAEKVDLATRYISLIEVGRSSPSLETIETSPALCRWKSATCLNLCICNRERSHLKRWKNC